MQFRIQALYNSKILSRCISVVFVGEVVSLVMLASLIVQGMIGQSIYSLVAIRVFELFGQSRMSRSPEYTNALASNSHPIPPCIGSLSYSMIHSCSSWQRVSPSGVGASFLGDLSLNLSALRLWLSYFVIILDISSCKLIPHISPVRFKLKEAV